MRPPGRERLNWAGPKPGADCSGTARDQLLGEFVLSDEPSEITQARYCRPGAVRTGAEQHGRYPARQNQTHAAPGSLSSGRRGQTSESLANTTYSGTYRLGRFDTP